MTPTTLPTPALAGLTAALRAPAAATSTLSAPAAPARTALSSPVAPVTPGNVIAEMVSGLFALVGFTPAAAGTPVTPPAAPPVLWAVLAFVRREFQRTFFNSTPTANPSQTGQSATGVVTGTLNAMDADGDPLSFTVTQTPTKGTVVINPNGTYTYTPTTTFAQNGGPDTFTVTVAETNAATHIHGLGGLFATVIRTATLGAISLPDGSSVTISVPVSVTPINRAPVAADDSYTTAEDSTLTVPTRGVLANDTDPNADPLTAVLVAGPAHGQLGLSANGSFTYTPTANFNGSDSFTYRASDGTLTSNLSTVTITVTPVNDPPVAADDTYAATEDTPLVVPVGQGVLGNDRDVDSPLTATVVTGPSNGQLALNPNGSFTYTPNANYNGADSFTYRASDGTTPSNLATVTIGVSAVNDPPVANPDRLATNEDTPLTIVPSDLLGNDTDPDGDIVSGYSADDPAHGRLTFNDNGDLVYTPDANFNGTDSFTYRAFDGTGFGNTATVTIAVKPVDDAPVAGPVTVTIPAGTSSVSGPLPATDVDGDVLTYAGPPLSAAGGIVSVFGQNSGFYTYIPPRNFTGTDTFTYTVTDPSGRTATATVTINVVNTAPTAKPDTLSTAEDTSLRITTGDLVGNDTDAEGNVPLTAAIASNPAHGTITTNTDGSFTYTPTANYHGADTFTYTATDSFGATSAPATVTINVTSVNDAPVATDKSITVLNDGRAYLGQLTGTDVDGDALMVSGPVGSGTSEFDGVTYYTGLTARGGSFVIASNGNFAYNPPPNYTGQDSVTFTVTDPSGASSAGVVTITVPNTAPTANPDTLTTAEDTPLRITTDDLVGNDTDVEFNRLTAIINTNPAHGTITTNTDGSFTYTPTANYNGGDSFTYIAKDSLGATSAPATVTIDVTPVNDAPVAFDDAYTVAAGSSITILASGVLRNDTDVDSASGLTAVVQTQPSHGTLALNANGSFTYTPTANYTGADSFSYRASDGTAVSNIATVSIKVNAAPVANDDSYRTDEDVPLTIPARGVLANDSDPDGDQLSAFAVSDPAHGRLTLNRDGSFTYTPNSDYNGSDSFTYRVTDGTRSSTATVTITVNPVVDVPIANNDSYSVNEDSTLIVGFNGVLANDTNVDGRSTATVVTAPAHGLLTTRTSGDGSFAYTPNANYSGPDSFTYRASNNGAISNAATVTITVNPVNDRPVAVSTTTTTNEDTSSTGRLTGTDVDGDPLTFTGPSTSARGGTVSVRSDGVYTYTPASNYNGGDSFDFTVSDGTLSSTGSVTINVLPVNDAVVAVDDAVFGTKNNSFGYNALSNDRDANVDAGEPLTIVNPGTYATSQGGSVQLTGIGTFVYAPPANFAGVDTFEYTVTDGTGTDVGTVRVTVVNQPVTARFDTNTTAEDSPVTGNVLTNDRAQNPDGAIEPLTVTNAGSLTSTQGGTVALNADGTYVYTPKANFNGDDSFTYTVADGQFSSSANVFITVTAVADPVNAVDDTFGTDEDVTLTGNVLTNDRAQNPDGSAETVTVINAGTFATSQGGTVTLAADGSFTYRPKANLGDYTDSFGYTVRDSSSTATGVVSITIRAVNDPVAAVADSASTQQDTAVSGNVLTNDRSANVDGSTEALTVINSGTISTSKGGTVVLGADGSYTYTPGSGFVGADSFVYTVSDGVSTATGAVSITVTRRNLAPSASDKSVTTNEDTPVTSKVSTFDPDGDTVTTTVDQGPSHGTVTMTTRGDFTYTPDGNYNGSDSFTYKASDGTASKTATVAITVRPVNDRPNAVDQSIFIRSGDSTTVDLTRSTSDPDGDALTYAVNAPSHGTVALTSRGFIYTPAQGYTGLDSVSYRANDGDLSSNVASVKIVVMSRPPGL